MPKIRFVCLANSYKEGGRCLAGIQVDEENNPIFLNGKPKWVRPVCKSLHGEIPQYYVAHLTILDIVEIEMLEGASTDTYQVENVYFLTSSVRKAGDYPQESLAQLCANQSLIFGGKSKVISEEEIQTHRESLMLISVTQFEVREKVYEDSTKPKLRLSFLFGDTYYTDFPITDPIFLYRYHSDKGFTRPVDKLYLCLSISVAWQSLHYKLVAGIIY